MGKIILWTVGLYLLYKLIFDFILPVYSNAKKIRKQFRDVQDNMKQQQSQYQQQQYQQQQAQKPNPAEKKHGVGEYIDFEEIK